MKRVTLFACALFAGVATTHAATYVVTPDGSGDYATIQEAIDGSVNGDVVELTDGIFKGAGNRYLVFRGKAITVRSQSGNPEACVIDCQGSESDPQLGIIFKDGEGPDSRLEGVTITNGWLGDDRAGAGGTCRNGSSPTIINCRFTNHRAGGAASFWCVQNSSPTLIDCVFAGGTALNDGAGLGCSDSSPSFDGCLFLDNHCSRYGAAIRCNFTDGPVLTDCVFSGNSGISTIRCEDTASLTLTNCTFTGNSSSGSVIRCEENASIQLVNSIIAMNSAAGAVNCRDNGTVTLSCSDIYGNDGGDWVGCIADQADLDGNVSGDPQFCSTTPDTDRNWALQSDSPCAADNSACGEVGAQSVGCAAAALRASNWGAIKATFRDASR